jgi:hypothetical protein
VAFMAFGMEIGVGVVEGLQERCRIICIGSLLFNSKYQLDDSNDIVPELSGTLELRKQ